MSSTDLERLTTNTIRIEHVVTAAGAQLEGRKVASHAS